MTSDAFVFDQDTDPNESLMREPKLAGEICARLIQWKDWASRGMVARWIVSARIVVGEDGATVPSVGLGRISPESIALRDEIAERLIEWAGYPGGAQRARRWLNMLGAIYATGSAGPAMLWLYIAFQTGDARQIAASFEERGEAKAVPRQAAHQEFTQALANLRRLSPDLANALRELYERHSPEAAAAGGMVATGAAVTRPSYC